jgi:putative membrane protein
MPEDTEERVIARDDTAITHDMDRTTSLAYDRTWLAYERTMQAWTRTAMSLITFGFTVYKLVDVVTPESGRKHLAGPHQFGIALVCIGFLALAMATLEYRQSINVLRKEYGKSPRSQSVFFAGVIALLGLFAIVSMLFQR